MSLVIEIQLMRMHFRLLSIIYFIAFIFNSNLSYAQIRFGPKAGLNFSELPNYTQYIIGNQHIYSGYHIGAIAEVRIFKQLFIQPGFVFTTKGSKYVVGNNSGNINTGFADFQFSSLNADIPVNLLYKFDLGFVKLLLIAGPQLGYGLHGKWKTTYGISSNVHFGNSPGDDFKTMDYGFNFGGGFEAGRIQISTQYYMGLRTLSTLSPPLAEQKFKVLNISIAWLFGKDKRTYKDFKSKYLSKNSNHNLHRKRHR